MPYELTMVQMHQAFLTAFISWNLTAPIEFETSIQESEDMTSLYLAGGEL